MENRDVTLIDGTLQADGVTVDANSKNIYNTGNIIYGGSGSGHVGGLFGYYYSGDHTATIQNVKYDGAITLNSSNVGDVGGIAGRTYGSISLSNVFNTKEFGWHYRLC